MRSFSVQKSSWSGSTFASVSWLGSTPSIPVISGKRRTTFIEES